MVRLYECAYNMVFLESMPISVIFIIYDILANVIIKVESSFGLIPYAFGSRTVWL